jgi:hypothetical protein
MRAISIKLISLTFAALMLSSVSEARSADQPGHNYTTAVGYQRFGFADFYSEMAERRVSNIYLGPLGTHEVPFSATFGLICFLLILLIVLGVIAMLAWRGFYSARIANRDLRATD